MNNIEQEVKIIRHLDDLKDVKIGDLIMIRGFKDFGSVAPERYKGRTLTGNIQAVRMFDDELIEATDYIFLEEDNGQFSNGIFRDLYDRSDERYDHLRNFLEKFSGVQK